jgi:hypothetical protein
VRGGASVEVPCNFSIIWTQTTHATSTTPTQTGGAVFINTGYAGGAYFIFRGNPTISKIWVAGHPVYLGNSTYSGALALRSGVKYFPAGGAAKQPRCVHR